ncbi:MAG: CYTH domain-containing protein [Candidatus Cloacimonetes bacterium]|nr:CYTH domain-containing protein [Candidatus Cloacimonadota bacterium]
MKEQELKIILSKNEYTSLINDLSLDSHPKIKVQENHYFDTKDHKFLKSKEMLRVRKTNVETVVTIKRNAKIIDGYFECEELEKSFAKCSWEKSNLIDFIFDRDQSFFIDKDLIYLGCLKNIRTIFDWRGFKLEVDQSKFSNEMIDYELECETISPQKLLEILDENTFLKKKNISYQSESKFKRFLKHCSSDYKSSV